MENKVAFGQLLKQRMIEAGIQLKSEAEVASVYQENRIVEMNPEEDYIFSFDELKDWLVSDESLSEFTEYFTGGTAVKRNRKPEAVYMDRGASGEVSGFVHNLNIVSKANPVCRAVTSSIEGLIPGSGQINSVKILEKGQKTPRDAAEMIVVVQVADSGARGNVFLDPKCQSFMRQYVNLARNKVRQQGYGRQANLTLQEIGELVSKIDAGDFNGDRRAQRDLAAQGKQPNQQMRTGGRNTPASAAPVTITRRGGVQPAASGDSVVEQPEHELRQAS